ncbi:guanyl-specific ribonuclease Sa [Lachnospiraceae bacterium JC7]|nr:guanyl-specific ribonuclease Sa [Lachnospiraceae bacterium JC7]
MNFSKRIHRFLLLLCCCLFLTLFSGCTVTENPEIDVKKGQVETTAAAIVSEDGSYTTKEDVSLYIYTFGHLPSNFITKSEARKLGWRSGGLDNYSYGKCIGGDVYGNREGSLPSKKKRRYYECDIDTLHAKERGEKRIIFSNDGLIYYTEDHYTSYELLYGDPS